MTARYPDVPECAHTADGEPCRRWSCRYSLIPEQITNPVRLRRSVDDAPISSGQCARLFSSPHAPPPPCRPWMRGGRADYLGLWDDESRAELVEECVRVLPSTCALHIAESGASAQDIAALLDVTRQGVQVIVDTGTEAMASEIVEGKAGRREQAA